MAPVRRYLRISKYSVVECRIYLDNPALVQTWLLNPRDPVLPRVVESIRPLVLPKLREERERSRKKSGKKKTIKDVIVKDDFEVSMFLTETSTRHSLLVKHKYFHDKGPGKIHSNSSKLTGGSTENPVDVDVAGDATILREEDSDEDDVSLSDIPSADAQPENKRRRIGQDEDDEFQASEEGDSTAAIEIDSDPDQPPSKRHRTIGDLGAETLDDDEDDKKKLALDVSYEGFAIYGQVLCLVVKKRERNKTQQSNLDFRGTADASGNGLTPAGQARMENWITSTQVPVGEDIS